MCGIVGYIGDLDTEQVLVAGLSRLTYRGYDSAGIAVLGDSGLQVRKAAGKLRNLEATLENRPAFGTCGIGHTRWATHGAPDAINAHPHTGGGERVAVVHNGIIENHEALRRELAEIGVRCVTATDTEVIPHLLAHHYDGDPVATLRLLDEKLQGSYAYAAIFADRPDHIFVARRGSPLLIGRGPGHVLLASDVPALLPHAKEFCNLEEGQIAELSRDGVHVFTIDGGDAFAPAFEEVTLTVDAVSKGDYDSFMAKEIAEQPEILQKILDDRIAGNGLAVTDLGIDISAIQSITMLACGTSLHAAMLGARYFEALSGIPSSVEIASEYRYRTVAPRPGNLVIPISQSGETADTLAGLLMAKEQGVPILSLLNVTNSSMGRESDGVLPILAGPEIGVASTKAYTAQALALYLLALRFAHQLGHMDATTLSDTLDQVRALPAQCSATLLECEEAVTTAADLFNPAVGTIFLGRGGEHANALEGALKLKEIAYVHAAGHPAGEFKHGPIALVTDALPVVCLAPRGPHYEKMLSNIEEVRARSGRLIAVSQAGDPDLEHLCDHLFPVARSEADLLQPVLSILPLQRYAYHIARRRGCDVDQPRNLAKSVTVE